MGNRASRDSRQPYAIVVGLDSLPGIQAARILARRGVPVIAIARRAGHYCCRTNACREILFANTQSDEFVRLLEALGSTFEQRAVLFPCTDMSVLLISRHRRELADSYHVVLPAAGVVETLINKASFFAYAQGEGFRLPRTLVLDAGAAVEDVMDKLAFPCVLKLAMRVPAWTENSPRKVFKVKSAEELVELYARCSVWAAPLIVQEWVEGPDANLYSCNCYFSADSEPVVAFMARKLRQWPPEAGISSLGEECRNDAVLQESLRLFRGVRYFGLGYVEMKCDERTGEHFVLEVNVGRPTGRSAIAEAGGVELLYAAYCDNVGWPLPEGLVQEYRGAKWIHLHYDFRSALSYWRRGDLTLRGWRRSWRGRKAYALFSWADPIPFWEDLRATLVRGAKRLLKLGGESPVD